MIVKRALALALCGSVSLAACAPAYATTSPYQAAATMSQPAPSASATQETSNQVQQLVAPIALYPDSLDCATSQPAWQTARGSGQHAILGPERQGTDGVSLRPGQYEQQPLLDVRIRGGLRERSPGSDEHSPGSAPACGAGGEPAKHTAADGIHAGTTDRH